MHRQRALARLSLTNTLSSAPSSALAVATAVWGDPSSAVRSPRRAISTETHFALGSTGSPLDIAQSNHLRNATISRRRGQVHRSKQDLWPTIDALEKDLTESTFAYAERRNLEALPAPVAQLTLEMDGVSHEGAAFEAALRRRLLPSGGGAAAASAAARLLSATESDAPEMASDRYVDQLRPQPQASHSPNSSSAIRSGHHAAAPFADPEPDQAASGAADVDPDDDPLASLMADATDGIDLTASSSGPALTSKSAVGSTGAASEHLEAALSFVERQRALLAADLASNEAAPTCTWQAAGLDPVLADIATARFGHAATRVQSRLLPALLNEDHNDVVLGGVTGAGKTVALMLAALQGIRNETAGMNIIVCGDGVNAMRLGDAVRAFCGTDYGGAVVDREVADMSSWLLVAPDREQVGRVAKDLKASQRATEGPVRLLITTPDTMCELLFEQKFEFRDLGYLRRCYVDDAGRQMPFLAPTAPVGALKARWAHPEPASLMLGTLHQIPRAAIRSLLQIACVSADVETQLIDHLKGLCLKPDRSAIIASVARLPPTLHCLFSFFPPDVAREAHVVRMLRAAHKADAIPGRVMVIVPSEMDLLAAREKYRTLGLDARLLYEVLVPAASGSSGTGTTAAANAERSKSSGGSGLEWASGWRYVLVHEHEAFGLDVPLISHVIITFAPTSRHSFLHMAGRAGRLGRPGWVITVAPNAEAPLVQTVAAELHLNVENYTVDAALQAVPVPEVVRRTKTPELLMDPQVPVMNQYEREEDPLQTDDQREFWHRRNRNRDFHRVDYVPRHKMLNQEANAARLRTDIMRKPDRIVGLVAQGLLNPATLKPTHRLYKALQNVPHDSPNPRDPTSPKFMPGKALGSRRG